MLREGWLLKQSKKLKMWQKRYFVLDSVALYWSCPILSECSKSSDSSKKLPRGSCMEQEWADHGPVTGAPAAGRLVPRVPADWPPA